MADKPANKPKRQVKNPETFRERAAKAADSAGQPSRSGRLKTTSVKAIAPLKPIGRAGRNIGGSPYLKWLRKPLRVLGKVFFFSYFRNSWRELRLVTWPSWSESRRLTGAVLIFAIIFGAVIAGVDWGLDKLFRNILLK